MRVANVIPGGEIALYESADGGIRLDVRLEQEAVWLTQAQMAELFGRERSVITKHINNVFAEGELPVTFYSLDTIISIGYRVKSRRGTQFRIWATPVLKDHLGRVLHGERLPAGARAGRGAGELPAAPRRRAYLYNVSTLRAHLMKTVNIRQLKNNPSDALRMARKAPVVVVNRDQPEAALMHLSDGGLLGDPGVRLAIATDLYRSGSASLWRGAKIVGIPLEEFMRHVSREGIPVIRGNAKTVREDLKNLEKWRNRR